MPEHLFIFSASVLKLTINIGTIHLYRLALFGLRKLPIRSFERTIYKYQSQVRETSQFSLAESCHNVSGRIFPCRKIPRMEQFCGAHFTESTLQRIKYKFIVYYWLSNKANIVFQGISCNSNPNLTALFIAMHR